MKIKYYFSIAMAALVMTNCSQEEELQEIQDNSFHTLTATIEGGSRSAVTDGGVFSWTNGDKISVWNGSSKVTYTYVNGTDNDFTGSANSISGYAVYPAGNHTNLSGSSLPTVNLESSYTYGSTNAIMMAKVQNGSSNLSFSHLGGLMRFTIKNIPSNAASFTFTANTGITGNFQVVSENGANVVKAGTATSSGQSVTISFTGSLSERTFYIPLPVGTYSGFTIAIGNQKYVSTATNTIKRRTLLLMPTFTCNGTKLERGDNSFKLENTEQEMNVGGNETLVIETPNSGTDAQLNLNYTPETNSTLAITDGVDGNSTDSKAKVEVNVSNNTPVAELSIDAPTLTVTLASGTYESVTAKTAKQTLIIKKGVTVKELEVFGGQLVIESGATVKKRTEWRYLTFEDADAKFSPYTLDYAGAEINTWSDLIDEPQYSGPLTYATGMGEAEYTWYDEGNTELYHMFPDNYGCCYWGGGHAISNYWGAGYSNDDRDRHIAKYYGEEYVENNAGNDAMLGWFNVQWMVPVAPHSGNNFAVHYGYKDFFSYIENLPEISFGDGKARVIDHMYVCNTNYTLNQLVCGVGSEAGNTFGGSWTGLSDDAWLKIVAYGYDSFDADPTTDDPTSTAEFYLVNGNNVVEDWQKWDLSELGKVAKVRFNFLYSDAMGGDYGFTIPGYFAYDDVAVRFEE